MNKIILLSDKEALPKGAFDFACMLNEHQPILLVGIFLPRVDYWETMLYYPMGGVGTILPYYTGADSDITVAQVAIPDFRMLCQKNGIDYRVHDKEYDDTRREIRKESRFADLVLLSSESFYKHLDVITSDEYVDNAVHHAECPVVVVPEEFAEPKRVILAYDGSASSVYAIRQFAQLMPNLAALETLLVYANPSESKNIPDKDYIEELVARHYPNLSIMKLDIDPKKYFGTWLANVKDALLVTGAQGRNGWSELFRRSFVGEILRDHQVPLFIAHK